MSHNWLENQNDQSNPMTNDRRLIEVAFPLKQASLDSVHEKNVRHGHISTLHIWPARRPLAACRAALIATLLPNPGTPEERQKLIERIGGKVKQRIEKKKVGGKTVETVREETEGGILHWGRESNPDMDWFREEICKAYGGRAPKVLDPFAGGGAIPLEAMRLGCEVTASDINPVAWFILKCTLEYPQKLAGQKRPLPAFVLKDHDFMEAFFSAQGFKGKALQAQLDKLGLTETNSPTFSGFGVETPSLVADLAWHVRAWGKWVYAKTREELASFYPTYADFQPMETSASLKEHTEGVTNPHKRKRVPLMCNGALDVQALNAEFDQMYLSNPTNSRWVPKLTVAYLWARTVTCKNCRATIPLLKTRWLCRKDNKRVVLTIKPNVDKTGCVFGVQTNVPRGAGNVAQRRAHDKDIGAGTMTHSGATCPCCNTPSMTMEDIRLEGRDGRLDSVMTAVIVDGPHGKEYRLPNDIEIAIAGDAKLVLQDTFADIPFGIPQEQTPGPAGAKMNSSSLRIYGFYKWDDLFSPRQLLALGSFVRNTRTAQAELASAEDIPKEWQQVISSEISLGIDKLADYIAAMCTWHIGRETMSHVFVRYAFPINWDFAELNPLSDSSGNYSSCIDWIARVMAHTTQAFKASPQPNILHQSALEVSLTQIDVIVTDPPYYDAISYSDLMDFFYVWLRRTLRGLNIESDEAFIEPLSPKWNHDINDGELIDNPSRFDGNKEKSKQAYEDGMSHAFQACHRTLTPNGRLVIVFAHKNPDAWETLVSAIIRAGFVVDGSWPIQTEMGNRTRAISSAALSSSVWLVCRKRLETARPGWDNRVLDTMRANIYTRLHEYWDAGIRGPDFVWAATGPALEAYSQHPVVKKANAPNQFMNVTEFLQHVRRIVVDFVIGRILSRDGAETVSGLDDVTNYYLLHRHDFGLGDAPIGACILYAVSCNLKDTALVDQYDILMHSGGRAEAEAEEEDEDGNGEDASTDEEDAVEGTGSKVRLKAWNQRKRPTMGYDPAVDSPRARAKAATPSLFPDIESQAPKLRQVPLIDQIHRLMHLWKAGDLVKVNDYLDARALSKNALFHQLLQALIELAPAGSEERALLESISNHVAAKGMTVEKRPELFDDMATS
jgi:putative DNA methylase